MIVNPKASKDPHSGEWWATVSTDDQTLYCEGGFRTRKEAKAAMRRFMIELRDALDVAIKKEEGK